MMHKPYAWSAPALPHRTHPSASLFVPATTRRTSLSVRQSPSLRSRIHCTAAESTTNIPIPEWNGQQINPDHLLSKVNFNSAGLVPAIAQQWDTGEILMMAWMNTESIRQSLASGKAIYYSRSRQKLWRKGETSGHIQFLHDFLLDCDGDTILLKVHQLGAACHTGRRSCFYTAYRPPDGEPLVIADVLVDPKQVYGGV